jgi:hypothetical protein
VELDGVIRMPFKRLVMNKRFVMSAALAMFGCADANTGGADVPPFSGTVGSPNGTGAPSVNGASNTPNGDATGTGSGSNGENGAAPSNPGAANEGQNANGLPIAPANGGNTNGGNTNGASANGNGAAAAPTTPASTPQQGANGMTAATGQQGNGMQNNGGTAKPAPTPPPPLDCSAPAPTLTNAKQSCAVNASGSVDGQSWFLWFGGSGGCITTYDQPGFKASWNNSGDFLARSGLAFDETKTFDQYGTIGADLSFTKTGSGGNYSFIGIYGWSNNPLVEYYIVDNSFGNGPQTPYSTQQKGSFTVDGATYKVYSGSKTNQPSIHGNANFQQFFSVRQTPRTCGHISISEHFKAWAGMGMTLGKMYESRILVEAGGGSGSINFTSAYVSASGG